MIDMHSYINEVATGLEMIRDVAREQNQKVRERMKQYYDKAIERVDQILREYNDSPANPTIVALPLSFLRAEKDLEEGDKVRIMVYSTLDGLASQCNAQSISAAIVLVWPDSMPATLHLNHAMHALDRHLQGGGTLNMYPPPYEERRSEMWHAVKKVCAEVVEVLTGPARGFDARVVDAYGTIDMTVPLGHPATSLGISPRRGDDRFHPWQCAVFLNQDPKEFRNALPPLACK
ncbi:unnamed protein product [Haemonchus placei]|uniref:FAD-oxidase_C domain-containing protein n=1 Tax=Haemonchus placei TaxID=6290 RepID=A0A0N4X4S7_HAEPC|nr:unnamed protein product [Haemonchus placei]